MKLIVDSNIFYSAIIRDSSTCRILLTTQFDFYIPDYTVVELEKHFDVLLAKSDVSEKRLRFLINWCYAAGAYSVTLMQFRLLLAVIVSLFIGCGTTLLRAEVDCVRFTRPLQRDPFTPPHESDTLDTPTAERMILRKSIPTYPELAVRAGLEGKVVVKVWIGHDGIVKQAMIAKSDAEIFNDAALDAARRLLFKRPSCGGIIISVWAKIPMQFKLVQYR